MRDRGKDRAKDRARDRGRETKLDRRKEMKMLEELNVGKHLYMFVYLAESLMWSNETQSHSDNSLMKPHSTSPQCQANRCRGQIDE